MNSSPLEGQQPETLSGWIPKVDLGYNLQIQLKQAKVEVSVFSVICMDIKARYTIPQKMLELTTHFSTCNTFQ
jgi:hypothetical protein